MNAPKKKKGGRASEGAPREPTQTMRLDAILIVIAERSTGTPQQSGELPEELVQALAGLVKGVERLYGVYGTPPKNQQRPDNLDEDLEASSES